MSKTLSKSGIKRRWLLLREFIWWLWRPLEIGRMGWADAWEMAQIWYGPDSWYARWGRGGRMT